MSDLPAGWAETTLGSIGEYLNGRGFKKSEWREAGRPIIRIQNLTGSSQQFNYFDGQTEERYTARRGDVLVSWAATLGVFVWNGPEAVINQHIFKVRSYVDPRFHRYLLLSVLNDLERQTHGSGMVHITKGRFDNTPVRLPPLAEQPRIVAAIEEQFSRLDAAVVMLEHALKNLKRMRAAVLQCLMADDNGNDWPTVRMGVVLEAGHYGTSTKCAYDGGGLPVLRIPNVQSGRLDLRDMKRAVDQDVDLSGSLVAAGDVLIIRTNGSRSLIGRCAIVPRLQEPLAFASYLIQLRFDGAQVHPDYLVAALSAPRMRQRIESMSATSAGQYNISLSKLRSLEIPLPPVEEQHRLFIRVEESLAVIAALEVALARTDRQQERTRSSILAAAFSGTLVPQDISDEPASMLLERVAADRAQSNERRAVRARKPKRSRPDAEDRARDERRTGIHLMWEDGYSMSEIADTMEISTTELGNEMTRMRKAGWDLPYRRRKATA